MDFSSENDRIRVRFHYESAKQNADGTTTMETGGKALTDIDGKTITTYCEVMIKKQGSDHYHGIAGDYVNRDSRDPFSKGKGRRLALARALQQVPDRNFRRIVWDNYFNNHRDGNTIPEFIKQEA